MLLVSPEAVVCRCSSKKLFWKISQISQETAVLESLFNKATGLRSETPTQLFSCEVCVIFKNAFFYGKPLMAASLGLWSTFFVYKTFVYLLIHLWNQFVAFELTFLMSNLISYYRASCKKRFNRCLLVYISLYRKFYRKFYKVRSWSI